uniref:Uncharacterized protein n=1 Tax=Lepeophtheirus salmonis TaxID=72036 RepID=A0A0K2TWB5_LEPSM
MIIYYTQNYRVLIRIIFSHSYLCAKKKKCIFYENKFS